MPQSIQICRRLAAAFAAAGLALGGCERRPEPEPSPPPAAAITPVPPATPLPRPPLGRAELLQALDTARSAYAAGQPETAEPLAGRSFAVRLAFGCGQKPAAQAEDGVARWSLRPKNETVEISLLPADWTDTLIGDDAAQWEAVEGFWLSRPWMRTSDCPAVHEREVAPQGNETPITAPEARTDGIAAVFKRQGSRLGRRDGKAFSFTLHDAPSLNSSHAGYRLVIEGRFSAFASGRAIRCQSDDPDDRPVCIAAAEVDRVAFETHDGKLLKEWRPS